MEKKVIRAALLGFGTVGTGVYKVLEVSLKSARFWYVICKKQHQR